MKELLSDTQVLAVVLARAGSKGLPRKNALPVAGRAMLAWTLEHAVASRRVSRVVLSTDGEELAAIAREQGVAVVQRPAELAHDTATVDAAARHAVEQLEAAGGERFDVIVILYGNVPVRPADLTDRAVEKLLTTGCDSVQSVCVTGKAHPFWMKRLVPAADGAGDAEADVIEPYVENAVYRRQDLPPLYLLDGGVLAVTRTSLFVVAAGEPHAFLGRDRRAVVTEPGEVVDVDSEVDWRVAEAVWGRDRVKQ